MVADAALERLRARMVGTSAAGNHGADRPAGGSAVTDSAVTDSAVTDSAVTDRGAAHAQVHDGSVAGGGS
jgi:hypothetical protein